MISKHVNILSIQRRLLRYSKTSSSTSTLMTLSALGGMTTMYFIHNTNNTQTEASSSSSSSTTNLTTTPKSKSHTSIIETDFMDKIASKSYLNYHNTFARDNILSSAKHTTSKVWNRLTQTQQSNNYDYRLNPTSSTRIRTSHKNHYDSFDKDSVVTVVKGSTQLTERPKGVPRRIRVLAIDVPEFREVFDGECRVNLSRIYPDDVAPRKYLPKRAGVAAVEVVPNHDENDNNNGTNNGNNNGDHNTRKQKSMNQSNVILKKSKSLKKMEDNNIEIIQKSLARSLVRCRNVHSKRIGVELLEASVYDLNPHNMRRTYQFGSYR